ncbi:Ti-type conjugative transfer relaxase TraA [Pseudorhizobium flavum]|uniref:Ti-type conjugative transfer relaxase TraA n=1 Tax=Pseudorhizobium flavum TaxID=1335061 RepID=A0A7W9Z0J2_9HYPH|nr:Ti-type conjugative transfer relaxase TraA [Pseudorhizobium flavum]MBB6181798.1 Ti-type conjugative transfer relaxase TraA [Pseudorhizobium flavum]CAD6629087.1 Ti-type conjugative transfer relaxase TraA [Pseudorhizobium flavum]
MAVPHFSVSIVARGSGRSAVLSAAYRHCAKMDYEREARTIDYTRKQGLLHEEFVVPGDAPEWLQSLIADRSVAGASEVFWNKVEDFEKRSDAQLAKDVTIALPIELSAEQNIDLVRDFVARHITAQGMVADWVFHDAPGNPHIHLMTTLRPLTEEGFGSKKIAVTGPDGKPLRNDSGKIVYELWAGGIEDFNAFRDGWFACQNRHLALAGLDIRIDGRSFEKQGIDLTPTIHLGVGTKAIERKTEGAEEKAALERLELQEERRAENARRIQRSPEMVLDVITREKSVFDERDVAKILHRYIDDAGLFQSLMARILQSPETLRLDRERLDFATGVRMPAKHTTRELIRLESEMANRAIWLSQRSSHGVRKHVLEATFARHDRLSDEQKAAIEHVAGTERIAAVIGRAGAGKTTMMKAAREAWEAAGYRVVGGALAGKAAEGLEKEAGIVSRTLSSWELGWSQGRGKLNERTVFVLDEAGMVSSRQMATFVEAVTKAGAKLVLVGDPEQLQPIEAGAAFRAIADRIGYAELETIYRQREQWMRDASLDLARGNIGKAVAAYQSNGKMIGSELKADAVANLISDWNRDYNPAKSTLILAHLRRDVRMLNELARATLMERGIIEQGFVFKTADGNRNFAAGDQIVFLKNEGSIGVKNGMLGKVMEATPGRIVAVIGEGEHLRQVIVEQRFYNNVDHGYATTVHKSQGATVDRVRVLASLSLDRHLIYVAMTRHREDLGVYYGRRSFAKAGGLVEILSRRNSKETTLDYAGGSIYRQALRFAEARGLHIVNVARTVARDRLEWTARQKQKLVDLAGRLAVLGARLGFATSTASTIQTSAKEAKPMVAGITTFSKSIDQAVEDKLASDPALKKQWEEVSMRFHHVYAQPEAAFNAANLDAMLSDPAAAAKTLSRITAEPEAFGSLKGKTGVFASRADKLDRDRALKNVTPLADSISDYLRQRGDAERRNYAEELAVRRQVALEIPALSSNARSVLERVRYAIDRNDLSSDLEYALADKLVKAELEGFAKAVTERFGERTFLPLAAKDTTGEAFQRVTSGMNAAQKSEVQQAWNTMRTVQQLSAHERTATAFKQAETPRQTRSQGLTLK